MKNKILAILFIYIYGITIQNAWALSDSTSFNPQPVIVAAANNSVPTGTVMIWTQEIIPEGWLECNGQPVKPEYELYKTMKKTPNYQGMFLRGAGSQIINHGSYGNVTHGTKLGEIQGDTIRNIQGELHSRDDYARDVSMWYNADGAFSTSGGHSGIRMYTTNQSYGGDKNILFNASNIVPTSEENRPINIGVKYIIKCD